MVHSYPIYVNRVMFENGFWHGKPTSSPLSMNFYIRIEHTIWLSSQNFSVQSHH